MHYNTTNETGEVLQKSRASAWKQDEIILRLFMINPESNFTPFEVAETLQMRNVPITSIRLAMNSLTKAGSIEKTTLQRKGEYGKLNYCWRLK